MQSKRHRWLIFSVILILGLVACSPKPGASSPSEQASPSSPQLRFQETSLECLDPSGQLLWSAPLPSEPDRKLAVLGQTVLTWGPSNNLRRFDLATGKKLDLTLALADASVYGVHDDILVQSATTGLAGIGERENLWSRMGLFTDSMVVGAGPSENPVVLIVQRPARPGQTAGFPDEVEIPVPDSGPVEEGRARAVHLKDGSDSSYPVPEGLFRKVEIDPGSSEVLWTPQDDGPAVRTRASDGSIIK